MDEARRIAEHVARNSYGRLVAILASRSGDIAAAEDSLAEAFCAALDTWPHRGVPARPEAWLITAARRNLGHDRRRDDVRRRAGFTLEALYAETQDREIETIPDHRLKLLFVCAHPAIDAAMRTPLMLQSVLGLDAARIAGAFLTTPRAMSQRLVRAKSKIRDAGIVFAEPEAAELPDRLAAVLAAIYAAFGSAWESALGADRGSGLAAEAIFLGRLLVALMPSQPEARGLLSLMLYCHARAPARRDSNGAFVPLGEQDTSRWSRPLILEAERELTIAARCGRPGRFQTEAAIQSLHVERVLSGRTDESALVLLYDTLADLSPSVGVLVARAAAYGERFGPEAGLALLDECDPGLVSAYQPYWAAAAHFLHKAGRPAEAALQRAIGLTEDEAVRAYLIGKTGAAGALKSSPAAPALPARG